MEKKHILNSPRVIEIKLLRRKKRRRTFAIFLICFFILSGISVGFSRYTELRIANIEITGNKVIENTDILNNVRDSINGYYFFVFPKNNVALIPQKQIIENLENTFSRLTNIKIEIKQNNILMINVSERTGSYTWCGEDFVLDSPLANTKCYFMDDTGYIFDEAPYFAGDVYFRFFGILEKNENINGYFAKDDFANYLIFKNTIESMDLNTVALLHKEDGETEFYLKHINEPPHAPKIIFNQKDDIQNLVENLKSVVLAEPLKTDLKEKYNKLLYIDLRFGNKVYFKFSE